MFNPHVPFPFHHHPRPGRCQTCRVEQLWASRRASWDWNRPQTIAPNGRCLWHLVYQFMSLGNLQQQPVMLFHFFPEKKPNLCSMYGISILEKPQNERNGNKCKDTWGILRLDWNDTWIFMALDNTEKSTWCPLLLDRHSGTVEMVHRWVPLL